MKHFAPPIAVDLLAQAIEHVRPYLDRSIALPQRCRDFWAAVVAARRLVASDVVEREFQERATACGLTGDLDRHGQSRGLKCHGRHTTENLVRWGLLNRDPFGRFT